MNFGMTIRPKYDEKSKLCYMDKDSFIAHVKTDNIYKDIEVDVETIFDTSNYELDRPLPKGNNKKVISLMKNELGPKIVREIYGLKAKISSYLIDASSEDNIAKGTKKSVMNRKIKFEYYKNCFKQLNLKVKQTI